MGKVMSIVSRKANRFNVENRAHRFLEKDKRPTAPKFEGTLRDLERAAEENPTFLEEQSKKNPELDQRLKQVYVTSKDSFIDYKIQPSPDPDRPLPLDRHQLEDFEYGYKEPATVSRGRCTLRQAIKFISDNQNDPELWTKQKVADEYKIKENVAENILQHFKTFEMFIPDIKKRENILTQAKNKVIQNKEKQDVDPPK